MTLVEKIEAFRAFIKDKLDIEAKIGMIDIGADELPTILLIPNLSGEIEERHGIHLKVLSFPINVRILSERDNPLDAIGLLEKLVIAEREFNKTEGNEFINFDPEFTDNQYIINCQYKLKNQIRNAV